MIENTILADKDYAKDFSLMRKVRLKIRSQLHHRILRPVFKFFDKSWDNEAMIARRQKMVFKCAKHFSLCISTTEAVLKGYNNLCSCPLSYLPVFVSKKKALENRKINKKKYGIFFTGRLTQYRKKIINLFDEYKNSYPLLLIQLRNKEMLNDFHTKLIKLKKGVYGVDISIDAKFLQRFATSGLINFINDSIYEYKRKKKIMFLKFIYLKKKVGNIQAQIEHYCL